MANVPAITSNSEMQKVNALRELTSVLRMVNTNLQNIASVLQRMEVKHK